MDQVLATATIAFPSSLEVAEPPDEPGGLPKRLARTSRVPRRHGLLVGDYPVIIGPAAEHGLAEHFPQHDLARLSVLAAATSLDDGAETTQGVIESVIDSLAFQMQSSLHIVAFDLLDVSPPLSVGEERELRADAHPESLIAPKFSLLPPNFRWQEFPIDVPSLHANLYPRDARTRMALWWYVKALDVPYAVDKFFAYWTSVEILWSGSDVRVTEPYHPPCQHELSSCPQCGRSVEKVVRGASLKQFLTNSGGLSEDEAKDLWKLRQVVHGSDVFTPEKLEMLGRLTPALRAAVLTLLKVALGDRLDQLPAIAPMDGPILGNMMALMGRRALTAETVRTVEALTDLVTANPK